MYQLGQIDIPARLAPAVPPWLSRLAVSVASVAIVIILRRLIDAVLPGVAPFALLSPGVLLATALGGWISGFVTLTLAEVLIWKFLLTPEGFSMLRPADAGSLILNTFASLLVIAVAQGFRAASKAAIAERNAKLATRELLFRELDHRVKNSFAIIASLLNLQRSRAKEPSAQEALAQAAQRIDSIARAHNDLYRPSDDEETVDLCAYLRDLCRSLSTALFPAGGVRLDCECDRASLERDRAVALGLIVNELVTNAAKHAFKGVASPRILVSFKRSDHGWRLTVSDNGPGLPVAVETNAGLGQGLIEAFTKQARGALSVRNEGGATFQFELEP